MPAFGTEKLPRAFLSGFKRREICNAKPACGGCYRVHGF